MRSRHVLRRVPRGPGTTDLPAVPRGHPVRRTARSASRAAGTAGCGCSSAGSRGRAGRQRLRCIACALLGRLNWPFGAYDLVETRLNWESYGRISCMFLMSRRQFSESLSAVICRQFPILPIWLRRGLRGPNRLHLVTLKWPLSVVFSRLSCRLSASFRNVSSDYFHIFEKTTRYLCLFCDSICCFRFC